MYKKTSLGIWTIGILCLLVLAACKKDPCEELLCQNGGTCMEGICECPAEYEGEFCETLLQVKFLGTYDASYDCSSAVNKVTVQAVPDSSQLIKIINLGDYACPDPGADFVELIAQIDSNLVNIPEQTVCIGSGFTGYTYQGTGSVSSNLITLDYTVNYESDGLLVKDECMATLEK